MNTQIEDFIASKNNSGAENYNNIDISQWNVDGCKKILEKLLLWISNNDTLVNNPDNNELYKKFEIEFNKQVRVSKITNIRKSILLNVLNNVFNSNDFDDDVKIYLPVLKLLLRKKPMRNISGITSITVITAPFPDGQKFSCKHNCYYCPNEPAHEGNNWQAQPRSYLYYEPAVLRANQHKFQAIGQMLSRLDTYFNNGHVIDK